MKNTKDFEENQQILVEFVMCKYSRITSVLKSSASLVTTYGKLIERLKEINKGLPKDRYYDVKISRIETGEQIKLRHFGWDPKNEKLLNRRELKEVGWAIPDLYCIPYFDIK